MCVTRPPAALYLQGPGRVKTIHGNFMSRASPKGIMPDAGRGGKEKPRSFVGIRILFDGRSGKGTHGGLPLAGKWRGFGLTPEGQVCIMHTDYMLFVNNKYNLANSRSGCRVMAGQMHVIGKQRQVQSAARNPSTSLGACPERVEGTGPVFQYPIPNRKYSIAELERLGAVSSFVPNKPNLWRSSAENADRAKERTQSKLIRPVLHGPGRSRPVNPNREDRNSGFPKGNGPKQSQFPAFLGRERRLGGKTKPIWERNAEKKIKHQESKIKIAESPRRDDDFLHFTFRTLHFALLREQRLAFRASGDRFQGPETGFLAFSACSTATDGV